ncbi:MAG: DUF2752 domain-containing protein [Oscillospiraceae bacterium]
MAGIPKIKEPKTKLLLTAGYLLVLVVWRWVDLPCVWQYFLHIPCPGCGMTRAILAALHFDFAAAFRHHFMFWAMPLLYIYFLFDGKLFRKPTIDKVILWGIALGFAGNWVIHLVAV